MRRSSSHPGASGDDVAVMSRTASGMTGPLPCGCPGCQASPAGGVRLM
jgi:hypothetical protein